MKVLEGKLVATKGKFAIVGARFNEFIVSKLISGAEDTNSQRGTATSTYLTSWDVGIGIGLMIGGSIAQAFGGFNYAYLFGACLTIFSTLFFLLKAGPHFNRNKLR